MNERGEYVYTLGAICFNMFKPGTVRCTIQHTMNIIQPVCRMDKTPRAAPWSLRRELAIQDPDGTLVRPNTLLKSYDIVVALTIEPGQFMASDKDIVVSPPCRLRATHVAHGFFLPDPEKTDRPIHL